MEYAQLHFTASPLLMPPAKVALDVIGVDLGGTLIKIVHYENSSLVFKKYDDSTQTEEAFQYLEDVIKKIGGKNLRATGGGAHKYKSILARLPIEVETVDEMDSLIYGLNFMLSEIPFEAFCYGNPLEFQDRIPSSQLFPYLLVNVGSGVSIIKVTGVSTYQRVSGTSLGGGTLYGLLSLLTNASSFDEMLEMATKGDNKSVDLLVGDIYGTDYNKIGLSSNTIASSFGKVRSQKNYKQEDLAKSLLFAVANNIGQISFLNAKIHLVEKIYFGGHFIQSHPVTMNCISFAINFWSQGEMKALFLKHDGYLGAIGSFVK